MQAEQEPVLVQVLRSLVGPDKGLRIQAEGLALVQKHLKRKEKMD